MADDDQIDYDSITFNLKGVPKRGFSDIINRRNTTSRKRAVRLVSTIVDKLFKRLSHKNHEGLIDLFKEQFAKLDKRTHSETNTQSKDTVVKKNIVFNGTRTNRILCQSILAMTYSSTELLPMFLKYWNSDIGHFNEPSYNTTKYEIGRHKQTTLKVIFQNFVNGIDLQTIEQKSRIDPSCLSSALHFISNVLQPIPGYTRAMTLFNHYFKSLPVYTRGGHSKFNLFEEYKLANTLSYERIGYPTFNQLLILLTTKGQNYSGLSTYYMDFLHLSNTFMAMVNSIIKITKLEMNHIKQNWMKIFKFLQYDYCHSHIDRDDDIYHCSKYALDIDCEHNHEQAQHTNCRSIIEKHLDSNSVMQNNKEYSEFKVKKQYEILQSKPERFWAKSKQKLSESLSRETCIKLMELYQLGEKNGCGKISGDKALEVLKSQYHLTDWTQLLITTVPKIKSFFSYNQK
ncbi:hypothetical protein BC833DRAFT_620696 [Globomyces pollinis-pini]|nr:hypothetical protein BC833DRAFT_620696 [Globomyces pollinis-pini]